MIIYIRNNYFPKGHEDNIPGVTTARLPHVTGAISALNAWLLSIVVSKSAAPEAGLIGHPWTIHLRLVITVVMYQWRLACVCTFIIIVPFNGSLSSA
jgi:hypothetical protein